jgi:hypothetical protein
MMKNARAKHRRHENAKPQQKNTGYDREPHYQPRAEHTKITKDNGGFTANTPASLNC